MYVHSTTECSDTVSPLCDISIPPQLKFLMATIKNVITVQLTAENHLTCCSQVQKIFRANGFEGYLDGTICAPPRQSTSANGEVTINPLFSTWILIDQILAAALLSTVSASLLPYFLNLESCAKIWKTISKRLQSTNRSRIIQLKNELHHISMANKSMQQYLSEIKLKVDTINAAGCILDPEDITLYTLNGLPAAY